MICFISYMWQKGWVNIYIRCLLSTSKERKKQKRFKNRLGTNLDRQWTDLHRNINRQQRSVNRQHCPVGWGCRIHRLLLCRGVRPPLRVSWYDTKQSDGEVPAVLELWGMRSTPSLPSLPGPLWPGVVAPDRALSMGWIELTAYLC